MTNKLIIGKEEWCALPNLGMPAIKARIDSGRETSQLHAFNIHTFKEDGEQYVHFDVHPVQENHKLIQSCRARLIDTRRSKLNNQTYYVIKTPLTLGEETWEIELTLTNHDIAGYRILLGRSAMEDRILIDPDSAMYLGDKEESEVTSFYQDLKPRKDGLRILVLGTDPQAYSTLRLIEAGQERGHDIRMVKISECYMNICADESTIHYRGGEILDNVDAVIPRIEPSLTFYGCALTRQFQNIGAFCLNDSVSIAKSRDKLRSLQLLSTKGVPMPRTGFANSPMDTNDIIQMLGGAPLVIKLLESTQGAGVVLTETNKAAESVINAFKRLRANILVQEYIKEAEGRDIRCFVIDGKVAGAMERKAAPGEFRANLHLGGTASPVKLTSEERRIALQAAKAMGLMVAGVDLIRAKDGPKILEINSSPGLEGIEGVTGKDIASLMIECIERHVKE
ncbi:MAG: 30S ribosomal protein S6--L-glutamate ligase [Bdellovibrionales bacterium]